MANSYVEYTGDGSTTAFAIPFDFISSSHLSATVAGASTAITVAGTTATFASAPASAAKIRITRNSSQTTRLVDYTQPSTLTEEDLDTDSKQAFFISQEAVDTVDETIRKNASTSLWDATSIRLTNVADPSSAQDAATKNYLENTWLSTTDKANLTTVAGISSNVTTVAGISSNVTAVAGNATNINAVAGNATNINTVAGDASEINTVAGISSDVTAVAADATDIGAVAGKATEIGRLGTADAVADMAILGTTDVVADMAILATTDVVTDMNVLGTADVVNDMNVLGTSGNVTNMNTLAGISSNITTVADNSSNVSTVAGISSNVTTVAGISANVTTAATNVADITNFSDVYIGPASSDPTQRADASALQAGDLYFNTASDEMKVYSGSAWQVTAVSTSGLLTSGNNLSDVGSAATARTNLGLGTAATSASSAFEPADADILKADTTDELAVGYTSSNSDAGTKSSGTFTPDPRTSNFQHCVNGGAHTLAPPAYNCTMVILYKNNASAGAVTTSGFTKVDGDDLTTTNGHEFFMYITRYNDGSTTFSALTVKALQ